jgi:outer membrane protein assembly factor BamD
VLGHNFPNSSWYKDSYALLQSQGLMPAHDGNSWVAKVWHGPVATPAPVQPAAKSAPGVQPPGVQPPPDTPKKPVKPEGPPPPSTLGGPST